MKKWHLILLTLGALFTLGACDKKESKAKGSVFELSSEMAPAIGKNLSNFPDKGLVNEEGEPFSFDQVKGRRTFVTFIYTNCPMPKMCPLLTQKTAKVQKKLSNKDDIRYLVFSFDPENDTPKKLKEYGSERGINFATAEFITGNIETLDKVMKSFGVRAKQKDDGTYSHNVRTYLADPDGEIVRAFDTSRWPVKLVTDAMRSID